MTVLHASSASRRSTAAGRRSLSRSYLSLALEALPRVLSGMDRNPDSPTYGSCDPLYWKHRVLDFAAGASHQAAWFLALVYATAEDDNPYAGTGQLKDWALAAMTAWMREQNPDGSSASRYAGERDFGATAMATWAAAETLALLRNEVSIGPLLPDLDRAAEWLARQKPSSWAHQQAAAAVGLSLVAQLTQEALFARHAQRHIQDLLSLQTPEGDFLENGRVDFGLQSLTLSALSRLLLLMPPTDSPLWSAYLAGLARLETVVDTYGLLPPAIPGQAQPQTQLLYLAGAALHRSPLVTQHHQGLAEGVVITPAWLDDRLYLPVALDALLTVHALTLSETMPWPTR